jgi:hypothetical protein
LTGDWVIKMKCDSIEQFHPHGLSRLGDAENALAMRPTSRALTID